jgi:hypothetical protein
MTIDLMSASDDQILSAVSADGFVPVDAPKDTDTPTEGDAVDTTVDETNPADQSTEEQQTTEEASDENEDKSDVEADKTEETTVEAQSQLDLLFAPLMANGKELKVDSIEDARRLMQMGLGFNKKMAALKPHLKLIKMLENNGLLDESKLSFLIDVNKKDPKAIGKLVADSNIDPLNLSQGNDYTPNTYSVSDSEMELTSALDDLKDSKHYGQFLDIVVNKLDGASKELLVSKPGVIPVLHEQVASGIYDKIMGEVEKNRALGRLTGLSDLEAYRQVGDDLNARGLLLVPKPPATKATTATATVKTGPTESELKSRKLAASPTKSSPGKKQSLADFNPLALSDEEIANMTLDKFN